MPLIVVGIDMEALTRYMLLAVVCVSAIMLTAGFCGHYEAFTQLLWTFTVVSAASLASAAGYILVEPRQLRLLVLVKPCEVIRGYPPGRVVAMIEGCGERGCAVVAVKAHRGVFCYGRSSTWVCASRSMSALRCLSTAVPNALGFKRFDVLGAEDTPVANDALTQLATALAMTQL